VDYEWSSAAAYTVGKPDELAKPGRHPHWFGWGQDEARRRRNYAAYLSDGDEEEEKAGIFEAEATFLGDEAFA